MRTVVREYIFRNCTYYSVISHFLSVMKTHLAISEVDATDQLLIVCEPLIKSIATKGFKMETACDTLKDNNNIHFDNIFIT